MHIKYQNQEPFNALSIMWLVLLIFLLALNPAITKITISAIHPQLAAFMVVLSFAAFFNLIVFLGKTKVEINPKQFYHLFLYSLVISSQILLFFSVSTKIPASLFTIVVFSFPVFVTIIAPMMVQAEKFTLTKLTGSVLAITGLLVAFPLENLESISILTYSLLVPFLEALGICQNKRLMSSVDKYVILAVAYGFSVIIILPIIILKSFDFTTLLNREATSALLFQILIAGVFCRALIQNLLSKHSAIALTLPFSSIPVIGVFLDSIVFGEQINITFKLIMGTLLVTTGIIITQIYS